MGLAKFEIKLDDELAEIPTLNDVGCSSCHALLDPIAGGFKNWRNKGNYREATRWTVCDEDFVLPGDEEGDACANNTGGSASLATASQVLTQNLFRRLRTSLDSTGWENKSRSIISMAMQLLG